MSGVAVTEALGETLSPSQATTYLACPAKWYFRYLVGLSEPATGALALGKAFHGALARNFRQKMSGEKVFVSVRGSSIRVTAHVYNTVENCDRLIACLRRIAIA